MSDLALTFVAQVWRAEAESKANPIERPEDVARLVEAALAEDLRSAVAVLLLLDTGMRVAEAEALTWGQVPLPNLGKLESCRLHGSAENVPVPVNDDRLRIGRPDIDAHRVAHAPQFIPSFISLVPQRMPNLSDSIARPSSSDIFIPR